MACALPFKCLPAARPQFRWHHNIILFDTFSEGPPPSM